MPRILFYLIVVSILLIIGNRVVLAAEGPEIHPPSAPADSDNWWSRWMSHVSEIQAAQPHWVTPLVTVTPRLEQEFRTDFVDQLKTRSGHSLVNYGNGKGLELIPFDPVEVILNVPPYLQHNNPKAADGFGDFTALVKYRILSSPDKEGDYIVTAFLGLSLPTGSYKNGSTATVYTPTIAAGKGLGPVDVQTTFGVTIPDISKLSHTLQWNTTFQYHTLHYLWPELEFNYSHYTAGKDNGQNQLFMTPGLMLGRFPIKDRVGMTIGAGVQIAATAFHNYDHAWILSARLPF